MAFDTNDPLAQFSQFGMPFGQPGRNQAQSRQPQRVQFQQPSGGPQRYFQPYAPGGQRGLGGGTINPVRSMPPGMGPAGSSGFSPMFPALANTMGADISRQQAAMNEMYRKNEQQIGLMEGLIGRGTRQIEQAGFGQRQALQGIAGNLEAQGRQTIGQFEKFRDQQMGRVDQDIAAANRFAAEARQGYEQAISDFKDTSAQDAANAAFGLRRNVQSAMQQINSGLNPDGSMMTPAERQAATQQLFAQTEDTVSQTVTGIFSNMNQQVSAMQGNLANITMGQSQTAMAGGQLRAQMGTSFGSQTLEAHNLGQRMAELGANYRAMGEQAVASALQQSVMFEMQGRTAVAEMIRSNPRQFVSLFAGLTGYLAAATTPGIENMPAPNFFPAGGF